MTATTMMRIREDLLALLRRLADEEGVSMQDLLARALEEHRRARMFAEAERAYAALQTDPVAWQQELDERRAWEATLMDGIEPEPDNLQQEAAV